MEEILLDVKQLAEREGCSESLIRKRYAEMERSGMFPRGVKQIGRLRINVRDFEEFLYHRRRMKNET